MYDIIGKDILSTCLNKKLKAFRVRSFRFNEHLCRIDSICLLFDTWIKLFFDEGVIFISEASDEREATIQSGTDLIKWEYLNNDNFSEMNELLNSTLSDFKVESEFKIIFGFESGRQLILSQTLENDHFSEPRLKVR